MLRVRRRLGSVSYTRSRQGVDDTRISPACSGFLLSPRTSTVSTTSTIRANQTSTIATFCLSPSTTKAGIPTRTVFKAFHTGFPSRTALSNERSLLLQSGAHLVSGSKVLRADLSTGTFDVRGDTTSSVTLLRRGISSSRSKRIQGGSKNRDCVEGAVFWCEAEVGMSVPRGMHGRRGARPSEVTGAGRSTRRLHGRGWVWTAAAVTAVSAVTAVGASASCKPETPSWTAGGSEHGDDVARSKERSPWVTLMSLRSTASAFRGAQHEGYSDSDDDGDGDGDGDGKAGIGDRKPEMVGVGDHGEGGAVGRRRVEKCSSGNEASSPGAADLRASPGQREGAGISASRQARGGGTGDAKGEGGVSGGGAGQGAGGQGTQKATAPVAGRALFTSAQAAKGHRSYMEDEYFLSADGSFSAVYDGHGGALVSRYLRQNLYKQVLENLPQGVDMYGLETMQGALKAAFKSVDDYVIKQAPYQHQGSTAVAVVIHCDRDGKSSIISCNVGDSRAVLSRRGEALDLTEDHKPNHPRELERIRSHNGEVHWFGFLDPEGGPMEGTGVYRINGNLAVARAIGDIDERPFVSGECEIRTIGMNPETDQFVILATDGLWDVMSSEEAVQYVHTVMGGAMGALREGDRGFGRDTPGAGDRPTQMSLSDWTQRFADDRGMIRAAMMLRKKKMARYLTEEAIRRGSMDNTTVVVVWLQ